MNPSGERKCMKHSGKEAFYCDECLKAVNAENSALRKALEYMSHKEHWYIEDKTGWMVMLKPRDEKRDMMKTSAYLEPWLFASTVLDGQP